MMSDRMTLAGVIAQGMLAREGTDGRITNLSDKAQCEHFWTEAFAAADRGLEMGKASEPAAPAAPAPAPAPQPTTIPDAGVQRISSPPARR